MKAIVKCKDMFIVYDIEKKTFDEGIYTQQELVRLWDGNSTEGFLLGATGCSSMALLEEAVHHYFYEMDCRTSYQEEDVYKDMQQHRNLRRINTK